MNLDSIVKRIAQQNRVSEEDIRRDMNQAIAEAYHMPNTEASAVLREDEVPTAEELILHCLKALAAQSVCPEEALL